MTRYERRQVPADNPFDVEGRVVAVLGQGVNTMEVLVEVGENASVPSTFEDVPEGVTPDEPAEMGYRDLQETAKALGIKANQSKEDLRAAIEEAVDE